MFPSLLRTLDELLLPGGSFLLVDPGRLGCSGCQAFADLIVEERPTWTIQVDTLSAATQFAREQVPNVEIFLPEQRRHGIAVALGSHALETTLSLKKLIAADEPYKMLRVKKPQKSESLDTRLPNATKKARFNML